MSKLIPLTQDKFAIVDDEDYDELVKYKWYAWKAYDGLYYGRRSYCKKAGTRTTQTMHRFLTGYQQTDHANGNGLDNRRENLRESTTSQNTINRRKHVDGTSSKYKGLYWNKSVKKWRAAIRIKGKVKHIGYFDSELSAALVYDSYARHFHGEFGTYNFPKESERSAI